MSLCDFLQGFLQGFSQGIGFNKCFPCLPARKARINWIEDAPKIGHDKIEFKNTTPYGADLDRRAVHVVSILMERRNLLKRESIPADAAYVKVAVGKSHEVFLRSDGTAVAYGSNVDGQCDFPAPQYSGAEYIDIAAGSYHTVLLRRDGRVKAFGSNRNGECDMPDQRGPLSNSCIQAAAGEYHTVVLRSDGTAFAVGGNQSGQCTIPELTDGATYIQVAAGSKFTALLRSDGKVMVTGGLIDCCSIPEGTYSQVAAGDRHIVLLRTDGMAVAFGHQSVLNGRGLFDNLCKEALKIPALEEGLRYTKIAAGATHTTLVRSDGVAIILGCVGDPQYVVPQGLYGNTDEVMKRMKSIPLLPKNAVYTEVAARGEQLVLLWKFVSVLVQTFVTEAEQGIDIECRLLNGDEVWRSLEAGNRSLKVVLDRMHKEIFNSLDREPMIMLSNGVVAEDILLSDPLACVSAMLAS